MKNTKSRKGRTNIPIKDEHYRVLSQYCELTGIPVGELMDECMSEFIECTIETDLEELAGQTASA